MPHTGIDAMGTYAHNIPESTPTVFGYVTGYGGVKWDTAEFERFHNSGIVHINQDDDINPHVGAMFDIEARAGDLSGWLKWAGARQRIGALSIAYVDQSHVGPLEAESSSASIDRYVIALAAPGIGRNAAESMLTGRVRAVQYAWPSTDPHMMLPGSHLTLSQANCDVWVCADDFYPPRVDHPRPWGVANAHLSVDLASGEWHVHGTPGQIRTSEHDDIMEARVRVNARTGRWNVERQ